MCELGEKTVDFLLNKPGRSKWSCMFAVINGAVQKSSYNIRAIVRLRRNGMAEVSVRKRGR